MISKAQRRGVMTDCFAGIALLTLIAAPIVAVVQHDAQAEAEQHSEMRAWKLKTIQNGHPVGHTLIGLGCGPDRLTLTAPEEDWFPAPCYAVLDYREACPVSPNVPYSDADDAIDCARYLGDGW